MIVLFYLCAVHEHRFVTVVPTYLLAQYPIWLDLAICNSLLLSF
jgi:hypothetical protein